MLKILFISFFTLLSFAPRPADPSSEVDALWETLSKTVLEGDFEGYAALYHDDAVLVNGISKSSYTIQEALKGWKQGFLDTQEGKMKAHVEFRFSQRLHNSDTAHDTGIFKYTSQLKGEEPQSVLVHMQALLVKKNGEWLMLMEHQISMATIEEWEAMAM